MITWLTEYRNTSSISKITIESNFTVNFNDFSTPYTVLVWLGKVLPTILYSLGFIGNLLALIIFSSLNEFRKISTGLLLLLLTVSNFVHLSTLTIESLAIYGYQLTPSMYFQCHLNPFIKSVSRGLSTYLSVGVAMDRLIRSEFPMRSRVLCTRRNVTILTIILLAIFICLWLLYLVPSSTHNFHDRLCIYDISSLFANYLINISVLLRAILLFILPVILMSGANIRMLRNIRQSQLRIADGTKTSKASSTVVITGPVCRRVSVMDRMLTYMMICNILTFIITQVPLHLYSVAETYADTFDSKNDVLIHGMILIWSSIYFGIAFYLYCLGSPPFRQKFIVLSRKIFDLIKVKKACTPCS